MSIKDFGSQLRSNSSSTSILESLMNQMKINCRLKNELLNSAYKGKGLTFVPKQWIQPIEMEKPVVLKKINKLPPKPLQRMQSTIVESGSYEVEKYRPNPSKTRPPKEKERLQNIMAFGKENDMDESVNQNEERADVSLNPTDIFNEILLEIKERRNFLKDMRDLGLEKKYLPEIQCQIALRFKELEKLDKERAEEVFHLYGV